jgi:photosystem II stability/assembly factor-like uncharacterized protein
MSPACSFRRVGLALAAVALVSFAGTRSVTPRPAVTVAHGCPPGFVSPERLASDQTRERRAEVNGLRAPVRAEIESPAGTCRARKAPERTSELLTIQADSGRRARGGQPALRFGAYAAALNEREQMAAGTLPGSAGSWEPVGSGPLIADDPRFDEVNGEGLADLNGRVADFAFDAGNDRLFAAVGEGGVWRSDDRGGSWHSIGDSLPTQAVGGIAYGGGTIVIVTGDNVFGGGGTFSGLGAFRSTDGGATWQHATGVPSGVIAFKVAADPVHAGTFYAATGAGLFRSTDSGATFTNVALPTGTCAGKPPRDGCALANMVTDVVVQGAANPASAGGVPGAVLAAVGWRAGAKPSIYGYAESPGNGVYRSDTGAPGTFTKGGGFAPTTQPGRIELGAATGADQDHRYVYATVEDAAKFNGDPPLDAPLDLAAPYPTNFGGVYVSSDFGQSWTLMESAEQMVADPASGSALNGTACAMQYCPGIQSWYNQWIAPDPSGTGAPKRLAFGLEEVWAATSPAGLTGPTRFQVIGPYFSGSTCLFLTIGQECPTTGSDPTTYNTTTHPDQHAGLWIPRSDGVTLVAANDGGAYTQDVPASGLPSPDKWGRGANQGFHTLLPYDAQVARDGTIWAGLQDNGELKIEPGGKQVMTFGGDGTFSAVDPDHSDIAYESTPQNAIQKTTDGGKTWNDASPPADTYQFVNPFVMDPVDAAHLLTAGSMVHETTDGAGSWKTVYDLGTRTHPGDPAAAPAAGDPDNVVSAIDVRGVGTPLPAGGTATPDFSFEGGPTPPGGGTDAPGTYVDRPFTIAARESNRSATITVSWASGTDDWDLVVYRKQGATLTEVGSSAQGPPTTGEQVVLARPEAGDYVIRVRNYAATGTFTDTAKFEPATAGDTVAGGSAAYVAYCGYCDALNTRPFANGLATNVRPDGSIGRPGAADNWHIASKTGLPQRYITSVAMDPTDTRTVYVTLAGYSRRWLQPGVLGPDEGATVAGGHVFKSTNAGETFTDISGNLPDTPADFALVRNGQLVVATDLGVFISADTSGGTYEPLGSRLPAVPVLSLELKPKASAAEPDLLIVATQGRGVYCYPFTDPGKAATGTCAGTLAAPPASTPETPGTPGAPAAAATAATAPSKPAAPSDDGAIACTSSRALSAASVAGAGRGLRLRFSRKVARPVSIDVFGVSQGRRVLGERLVARFTGRSTGFTWNGRANHEGRTVGDGYYFVRFTLREASGVADVRRLVLLRSHGRWSSRPAYYGREGCSTVRAFKLLRPVFGGSTQRALGISVRLTRPGTVAVTVRRGTRVIKRYPAVQRAAGSTYRLSVASRKLARGDYRVTIEVRRGNERIVKTLTSRRL